jgi:hypothetical protein
MEHNDKVKNNEISDINKNCYISIKQLAEMEEFKEIEKLNIKMTLELLKFDKLIYKDVYKNYCYLYFINKNNELCNVKIYKNGNIYINKKQYDTKDWIKNNLTYVKKTNDLVIKSLNTIQLIEATLGKYTFKYFDKCGWKNQKFKLTVDIYYNKIYMKNEPLMQTLNTDRVSGQVTALAGKIQKEEEVLTITKLKKFLKEVKLPINTDRVNGRGTKTHNGTLSLNAYYVKEEKEKEKDDKDHNKDQSDNDDIDPTKKLNAKKCISFNIKKPKSDRYRYQACKDYIPEYIKLIDEKIKMNHLNCQN